MTKANGAAIPKWTPAELGERLGRAVRAVEDVERRQDELWVEWTLLQADAELLNRKLAAFAKLVPGCLTQRKG